MKNLCSSRIRHGNEQDVNTWDSKEISNLDRRHASVCVELWVSLSENLAIIFSSRSQRKARARKPGEEEADSCHGSKNSIVKIRNENSHMLGLSDIKLCLCGTS